MNKSNVAIVGVADIKIEEFRKTTGLFEDEDAKPNGMAIIFGDNAEGLLGLQRDLLRTALKLYTDDVSQTDARHPFNPNGMDDDLKQFTKKFCRSFSWFLNCTSNNGPKLNEFHEFDRIELKSMLEQMARSL
jgi:predicted ATPase